MNVFKCKRTTPIVDATCIADYPLAIFLPIICRCIS